MVWKMKMIRAKKQAKEETVQEEEGQQQAEEKRNLNPEGNRSTLMKKHPIKRGNPLP